MTLMSKLAWSAGVHKEPLLLQSSYWQSVTSAPDMASGYPLSVVVHAGFRPQLSPDVSLHNISLSSFLYAFIGQWNFSNTPDNLRNNSMLIWWSLDVQSFELHADVLAVQVQNLQALSVSFRQLYPFLEFRFVFAAGIASTYRKTLRQCDSLAWCRYTLLLEEDWLFEHSGILAPISDLIATLDRHSFMTSVRFNSHSNNCELQPWDAPCLVRDARVSGDVQFLKGASFSNNPHISRASTMVLLLEDIYDFNSVADQGLEHGSFKDRQHSAAGLYSMCAILTYDCIEKPLFLSGECDCNWRQFNNTEADVFDRKQYWMTSFTRSEEDCLNDAGQRPEYDHCGLYMYGGWDDSPRISHLNGKVFISTTFWQDPRSPLTADKLPYFGML